ncbi:MAG TPA: VWA domain-containing protein, partial [Terriglobales bacterium]|nr:VWA domain-containing protein [Terriglobales bacterium]
VLPAMRQKRKLGRGGRDGMVKLGYWRWAGVGLILGLCLCPAMAPAQSQTDSQAKASASGQDQAANQSQNQQSGSQDQQNMPDAPSASRPAQPFPTGNTLPSAPRPQPDTGSSTSLPAGKTVPVEQPPGATATQPPPPQPKITPVPPTGPPNLPTNPGEKLYTLTANVNFVVVPVTVKDDNGTMVEGLLPQDFAVYENGTKQRITFFTSDPFPLSAAVIIDTGVPSVAFSKVKQSLSALEGSFSQFDEISLYTYSNVVQRTLDFTAVNRKLDATLAMLRDREEGETGGPSFSGGPLNSSPTVNGLPVDQGAMAQAPPPRMSHVLNDALLEAAVDLSKRKRDRRKVIFIISDGRDIDSTASYREVLKFLLSHNISVYAVAVSGSAIPVYRTAERIHVPGLGRSNILPKYAAATGGQVFPAFTRKTIEDAYGELTREARNQYTIGYMSKATISSGYRDIEVRVDRPNLKIVTKYGYYPLPPGR